MNEERAGSKPFVEGLTLPPFQLSPAAALSEVFRQHTDGRRDIDMRKIVAIALVTAVLLIALAVAANASPTRNIKYVRVGETADGQPVYVAVIQLKYMHAALAARVFGGQVIPDQNTMMYRPSDSQNYGRDNSRYNNGRNNSRSYMDNDIHSGYSRQYQTRY